MLNLFGVNVATVTDSVKAEYINQRNAFDSAIIGNRENGTKLKYMFYVNKKDADMAVHLINSVE